MPDTRLMLLGAVVALTSCSPAPVVSVMNRSPYVLSNVLLFSASATQRVDMIAPGEERRIRVRLPRSSWASIILSFDAPGKPLGNVGGDLLNRDSRLVFEIQSNLTVNVSRQILQKIP